MVVSDRANLPSTKFKRQAENLNIKRCFTAEIEKAQLVLRRKGLENHKNEVKLPPPGCPL